MAGKVRLALILALAFALPAGAQNCPPQPDMTRVQQDSSLMRQWKSWCECCGGTVSANATTCEGVGGPNWRCRGSDTPVGTGSTAADAAAAAIAAASQGQNDLAVGYGLLSLAATFGASLDASSQNAKARQAALLARQQAESEERRRIAALVADDQRRRDELAIATLKTESVKDLQLKSVAEAEHLKGSSNAWDGGIALPDPDSTPRTLALAPSAVNASPEKSWNAPRCEAQLARMRELDLEMDAKLRKLDGDLQKSAREYLLDEYGISDAVNDAKTAATNALLDSAGVRELYEEARGYYNSAALEFANCTRAGKGVIECLDVGRRLEERAKALIDQAAERAGIKGAKDRVAKAGKATRTAAEESHRIFADAAPKAAQILGSPCP